MGASRVRVVVAVGSAITAKQLARDLAADPAIAVQTATNIGQLFDAITLARPSVVLLDAHLAGRSTAQLTEGLSRQRQIPVVLRADPSDPADLLLDCLDAGALAISTRPRALGETAEANSNLIWTLRAAADAAMENLRKIHPFEKLSVKGDSNSVLALAGGIGSLPALQAILSQLPSRSPGGVAIAPLPAYLIGEWVKRVAGRSEVRIKTAVNGELVQPGQMLIAPGNAHMMIRRTAAGLTIAIKDGPAVAHHKPSIDVLFNSLAESAGASTVAAYLSGSGDDGVTGLLNLRNSGARTIIESPGTAICPDASARAHRNRAGEFNMPLQEIARQMLELSAQLPLPRAA